MRCRNCHTVMMDTEPECPACHAPAYAAPGVADYKGGNDDAGLRTLIGLGGGAVGLALYEMATSGGGGQQAAGPARVGYAPGRPSGNGPLKRLLGLLFLLAGGAFLVVSVQHLINHRTVLSQSPRAVTAAEIRKAEKPSAAPGGWLSLTFEKGQQTGLSVVRRRPGGLEVQATYLLVQAEDKWLLATVPSGFNSNRLVGRLYVLPPSTSEELVGRIRETQPTAPPPALLPYEFEALDGDENEQRTQYYAAGIVAVVALLGLGLGLRWVRRG
jgi:hypothetical protein